MQTKPGNMGPQVSVLKGRPQPCCDQEKSNQGMSRLLQEVGGGKAQVREPAVEDRLPHQMFPPVPRKFQGTREKRRVQERATNLASIQ